VIPRDGARRPAGGIADRPLGNTVGAIGWPCGTCGCFSSGDRRCWGTALSDPLPQYTALPLARAGGWPGPLGALRLKIVTWLILPVVICLSQRLSHACLSISNLYSETANGSLNQLSFI
jgi:hypothetical protein